MDYEAVLFDLDGTLLDTLEDLADSMNAVLECEGFPVHETACYRYFVGDGMPNLVRRVLPEANRDRETIEKLIGGMRAEYGRRWADKTKPYEGVPELLDGLEERGVPMAICSNKPDGPVKEMVDRFLGLTRFRAVLGSRPDVPRKPDPTAVLEIADSLGIAAERFVYLGDTNTDMLTAIAAHMCPVGALWGFRTPEELVANGAKKLIERPQELLDLF